MRLVLTPGDPQGIGPEVAVKAIAHGTEAQVVLLGATAPLLAHAKALGVALPRVRDWSETSAHRVCTLEPKPGDEPVEVRAIREAVAACLDGRADGMVTGPIHKARLARKGFAWPGHTGFLGHLCGVPNPVMAFTGGRLRVALVSVHLSIRDVPAAITPEAVLHTITTADGALKRDCGLKRPRLAVCGLNPHAGDGGLLGHEEIDAIAPAIAQAVAAGIDATGPISAEAAFLAAISGQTDLVVAMYHDQGLAPLKVVDFGRSVNWTLGLPIIRTSVDHGTADDLVGTGRADPGSMIAAITWAQTLATHKLAFAGPTVRR